MKSKPNSNFEGMDNTSYDYQRPATPRSKFVAAQRTLIPIVSLPNDCDPKTIEEKAMQKASNQQTKAQQSSKNNPYSPEIKYTGAKDSHDGFLI